MTRRERFELFKSYGWTYNPKTGEIFSHTGKLRTALTSQGYINCSINLGYKNIQEPAHRLAYYLYHGTIPKLIDHENRIKTDNRITNLREVSLNENQWNRDPLGYSYIKKKRKYLASISVNSKRIYLGSFKTPEEARAAYLAAKEKYHQIPPNREEPE